MPRCARRKGRDRAARPGACAVPRAFRAGLPGASRRRPAGCAFSPLAWPPPPRPAMRHATPGQARDCQATTSCECRTALLTSRAVPEFLGHADAESFAETVLSRRGDDHSAAVLHPFGPAQIETTLGEGGSYPARDVWPSFGPIDAQSTEVTAF